ncbi:condensation domain-containing protein [Streptomyces sp. NPDC014734]|uniref:condensation domain-containing protein n=1 Tax=Streptomyces sp. NPDC014734 TaxID=3364886 RepID=UPI0036FF5AFC
MTAPGFVEEELALLWGEVLNVTGVVPTSRFGALGGDGGTADRLAARIDADLGVRVDPARLLGADTLGAMAGLVREAMRAPAAEPAGAAPAVAGPGVRDERPPLSFAQQRLWFMQQLDPDTTLYNVPTVLRLHGVLDRAALGRALDALVARHEVLRTTYAAPSGRPHQVIAPPAPVPLPHTDLAGEPDPVAAAERVAAEEAAHVFDLATAPPLTARLVRLGDTEHRLMLTFHHIAVDGAAVTILYHELGLLYGSGPGTLPEVTWHCADHAAAQRARLTGRALDSLTAHWRSVLGDDPKAPALPSDRPRPATKSFRGAVTSRELRPELSRAVRDFGRRERATPNMTHLAALYALLAGWADTADLTVGIPAAGRNRPEAQDMVGCLINMVPVRARLDGDPGFRELLARVRAAVLDATAHQDLPFDKLVEALVSRRGRDFMPVFRVMFSYLGGRRPPVFDGLDGCVLDLTGPQDTAKYDLSLYVEERGDGVALTLEYDTDLFGPDTPAALLAAYERTLEEVVAFPDRPVPDLAAVRSIGTGPGTERNTDRER